MSSVGLSRDKSMKLSGSEIFFGFTVTGSVNLSVRVHVVPNYIHLQVNFSQTIDPNMMRLKIPYE